MSATLWDKVTLLPAAGLILGKVLFAAVTGVSRSDKQAELWSEHVNHAFLRGLLTGLSIGQAQILFPPFVNAYESWCKKNKLKPQVVDIPNTTVKGFWLGNPDNARYTVLYLHGGGFANPGLDFHLEMLSRWLTWTNGNIAIFCLAYTVTPMGVYPQQLGECVEGLRYVLSLPNRSPDSVLMAGDSAGGNLALAVLAHISGHPHPQADIVKPLDVQGSLKGGIVIAPWVSSEDTPSSKAFGNRDIINKAQADIWIAAYKGGEGKPDDNYIVPEQADSAWWKGMKIWNLLATAGEHEVLHDAIVSWARKFEQGFGSDGFKLAIGKREIHDHVLTPIPDAKLDTLGDNSQEGAIKIWLKQNLT